MVSKNIQNFLELKLSLNNLSRTEFSTKCGISYTSLHQLLHATKQNPALDTILKIANYFNEPITNIISQNNAEITTSQFNNLDTQASLDNLKNFLIKEIKQNNLHPVKLAHAIGVGSDAIKDFIKTPQRKKSIGLATLVKLSEHWDISIDEMIGRTTPEKSKATTQEKSALSSDITPDVASKLDKIKSSIAKNTQILKDASSTSINSTKTEKPQSHVERLMQQRSKQSNNRER